MCIRDRHSKYPVPVRLQLPRDAQVGLDALLALPMKAANGTLVPLSELVRVERGIIDKPLHTKDLQPVHYVLGDMGGGVDSPNTVAQWTEGETTRLLSSAELPGLYLLRPRFLSKAESVVYLLLKAAFPRHEIFARVRLSDVLQVLSLIHISEPTRPY